MIVCVRNDWSERYRFVVCRDEGKHQKIVGSTYNGSRPYSFEATASYAEPNNTKDTKWFVQTISL